MQHRSAMPSVHDLNSQTGSCIDIHIVNIVRASGLDLLRSFKGFIHTLCFLTCGESSQNLETIDSSNMCRSCGGLRYGHHNVPDDHRHACDLGRTLVPCSHFFHRVYYR